MCVLTTPEGKTSPEDSIALSLSCIKIKPLVSVWCFYMQLSKARLDVGWLLRVCRNCEILESFSSEAPEDLRVLDMQM